MAELAQLQALMGLSSMSEKAANVLFQFALEVGPAGAGKEAQTMGKEMSSFSSVLAYLVSVLSRQEKSHALHCLQMVLDLNWRYLDMFADILDYPTYTRPAFRWKFNEPKINLLRVSVESYKNTLSLLVATVEQSRKPSLWR